MSNNNSDIGIQREMRSLGADFILCLSEISAGFYVMLSTTKVKLALQIIIIPLPVTMNRKIKQPVKLNFRWLQ